MNFRSGKRAQLSACSKQQKETRHDGGLLAFVCSGLSQWHHLPPHITRYQIWKEADASNPEALSSTSPPLALASLSHSPTRLWAVHDNMSSSGPINNITTVWMLSGEEPLCSFLLQLLQQLFPHSEEDITTHLFQQKNLGKHWFLLTVCVEMLCIEQISKVRTRIFHLSLLVTLFLRKQLKIQTLSWVIEAPLLLCSRRSTAAVPGWLCLMHKLHVHGRSFLLPPAQQVTQSARKHNEKEIQEKDLNLMENGRKAKDKSSALKILAGGLRTANEDG